MIYMANNSDFNSDVEMILKDLLSRACTDHLETTKFPNRRIKF